MTFWFRKKFPDLPLCLDFDKINSNARFYFTKLIYQIRVHINGVPSPKVGLVIDDSQGHEFIRLHSFIEKRYIIKEYQNLEWNYVEIFVEPRELYKLFLGPRIGFGSVGIYGKKTHMEDILFWDPHSKSDTVQPNGGSLFSNTPLNSIPNDQGALAYMLE